MSFMIAAPEALIAAATDLAAIGSTVNAATTAAAAPTTGLLAAGADEVSAAVAALFGAHGQAYQNLSAQAAAFHQRFVQSLTAGAGAYTAAEAAATSPLQAFQQEVLNAINAPTLALLGRPLIGNGANGAPGSGAPGRDGGILFGNGGAGGSGAPGT
ncbi:PE family protein, partial [Mycobacterium intermedium]